MPVKNNVSKNYNNLVSKISGPISKRCMTEITIVGQANAAALTPILDGNLINSQYRKVNKTVEGWEGKVGYTANYAAAVHGMSGKLKGKPRSSVKSFTAHAGTSRESTAFGSDEGNFWDPDAEPQFLRKGFERDGAEEIQQIIKRSYKL